MSRMERYSKKERRKEKFSGVESKVYTFILDMLFILLLAVIVVGLLQLFGVIDIRP